jgi:hypothetical protein
VDWKRITKHAPEREKRKIKHPAVYAEFELTHRAHETGPDWLWLCNYPGTLMQMYLFNTGSSLKN